MLLLYAAGETPRRAGQAPPLQGTAVNAGKRESRLPAQRGGAGPYKTRGPVVFSAVCYRFLNGIVYMFKSREDSNVGARKLQPQCLVEEKR
jgi:hypothetical protein